MRLNGSDEVIVCVLLEYKGIKVERGATMETMRSVGRQVIWGKGGWGGKGDKGTMASSASFYI